MNPISKQKVTQNLKATITKAVAELGGFEKYISKGDTVFLKPNFNTADPFPASSDIGFLKVVTELVYESGADKVILGESSTFSQNTGKNMQKIGVSELAEMDPAPEIVNLDDGKWVKHDIPNGKYLKKASIPEILSKVDKLILLPCLKTHFVAQYTGALKLSVGFMKPSERLKFHIGRVQEKTAELNQLIQPDLIIMDARKCFITKGPMDGEVKEPGLIFASTSRVAIDIEGIKTIQSYKGNDLAEISAEELPQIKKAVELGIDMEKTGN